jgi:hypothetical protein
VYRTTFPRTDPPRPRYARNHSIALGSSLTNLRRPVLPISARNGQHAVCLVKVLPLQAHQLVLRPDTSKKANNQIGKQRQIICERRVQHSANVVNCDELNFLPRSSREIYRGNRILKKILFISAEIEKGSQVAHHEIAPAGWNWSKQRLNVKVRNIGDEAVM